MIGPAIRMLVSLGIVLALMYVAAMLLKRTHGGSAIRSGNGAPTSPRRRRGNSHRRGITMNSLAAAFVGGSASSTDDEPAGRRIPKRRRPRKRNRLEVLARQSLGKNASVAVVRVGDRTLIVGVTDMNVQLLSEVDASVFDESDENHEIPLFPVAMAAATAPALEQIRIPEPRTADTVSASGISVLDLLRDRTVRRV
jgi:flagellar protein FliO/FliZ